MKYNEKKLVEFLDNHIGCNYRMFELIKDSGACGEMSDEEIRSNMWEINDRIEEIAEKNGYLLNSHHHDNHLWGMPWDYDFYIEVENVEKDIARIRSAVQLKMQAVLIENEYGIWDQEEDMLIGFRRSIPGRIKALYDEIRKEIEQLENGVRLID